MRTIKKYLKKDIYLQKKWQEIIHDLRLILKYNNGYQKIRNFIDNKVADRTTKFSKNLQQNNSETFANKNDKEIPKERYISPEERKKLLIVWN